MGLDTHAPMPLAGHTERLPVTSSFSSVTLCCTKSFQSRLTLCDPMDCSPERASVCGILHGLEWVAMSSSRVMSLCDLFIACT